MIIRSGQPVEEVDEIGWKISVGKSKAEREMGGQFFTPAPIARFLASWFTESSLNQRQLHVLDPGAGGGVLTAALSDRIAVLRKEGKLEDLESVTLECWEADSDFLSALGESLSRCAAVLSDVDVVVHLDLREGCYVEGSVELLDSSLFRAAQGGPSVTHAILNPPYRKISARSRERKLLASAGMDTSNLYSAFVWLALRRLVDGGELSAITPRSFCNGPYFRGFRQELLTLATIRKVHLFDSRSEAFGRDDVLQESVLFCLKYGGIGQGAVEVSSGSLESPNFSQVKQDDLVSPSDTEKVIHLAIENDAQEVRAFFHSLPCVLDELDLTVSTGPVVDFRLRDSLSQQLEEGTVPLIYPHCLKLGKVNPPHSMASSYDDSRLSKKPVAIVDNEVSHRWLLPRERFVLIKRFSSKEERRRLVAGVLEPELFSKEFLGIENHINYFHRRHRGLEGDLARGLSRFLNSTVADRYFRQFNGHTQVNVSDLRAMRYPAAKDLEILGSVEVEDSDQVAIDKAMTKALNAPCF